MDCFELWAPVMNYDVSYEASTLGRVVQSQTRAILPTVRSSVTGNTYVQLRARNSDIWARLDQTVLSAHIGLGRGVCEPIHRDGNPGNNRLSNLEWGQVASRHGPRASPLSDHEIYDLWLRGWTAPAIARFFETDGPTMQAILDRCQAQEETLELLGNSPPDLDIDLPF